MSLGFGLFKFDIGEDRARTRCGSCSCGSPGILADTAGVLLALLWTAGFLPTFLEPQAVTVLLAKPAPRWSLLVRQVSRGGAVRRAARDAVRGRDVARDRGRAPACGTPPTGSRCRCWSSNFAVFYAFSAFLAVCTRSTVVAVFGTLLFWVLCWAMNLTHHHIVGFDVQGITPTSSFLVEAGYWTLPKPLDMSGIFFDAMKARNYSAPMPELTAIKAKGEFHPELSVLSSLAFAVGILALAAYEFRKTDY